jgi:hypothetical protein
MNIKGIETSLTHKKKSFLKGKRSELLNAWKRTK